MESLFNPVLLMHGVMALAVQPSHGLLVSPDMVFAMIRHVHCFEAVLLWLKNVVVRDAIWVYGHDAVWTFGKYKAIEVM